MKILILSNDPKYTFDFRKELIITLIKKKYQVIVATLPGSYSTKIKELGAEFIEINYSRHGTNPFSDYNLYKKYKKVIKNEKPNLILTYTIKPNIYGGLAAQKLKIPYIANITGLGTAVENKGLMQKITTFLYKRAFKKIDVVFFQNNENKKFFEKRKLSKGKHVLLPGSGVNLSLYMHSEMAKEKTTKFIFISRLMKEKGFEFYLESAKYFKEKYKEYVEFHILGSMEENYKEVLKDLEAKNIVTYHGRVDNVSDYLKDIHCIVHPTYYPEGMSNVLLEAAATGRAIITTNRSGTREIVDDGINGFLVEIKQQDQLNEAVERFIKLPFNEKRKMGIAGRKKVEREFDRNIIVDTYIREIKNILK